MNPTARTRRLAQSLDGEPGRNPDPAAIGNLFSSRAPFDTNGLYGYVRLEYRWGLDG